MKKRDYVFKVDKVKPAKLSKPEIIDSLKTFYRSKGNQPFTMREYDKWEQKPITTNSISQVFGSWSNAMRQAGLKPTRNQKKDLVEMVEIFKDAWEHYDAVPSAKQLDIYLKQINAPYSYRGFYRTFGNIGKLVDRVIKHQEGKISDSELSAPYISKHTREHISPGTRDLVFQRDNYQCVNCGKSPKKNKGVQIEVDHIIPVSKGGSDDMSNLQTLCDTCNSGKSNRDNI